MISFTFDCPKHADEMVEIRQGELVKINLCSDGLKALQRTGATISLTLPPLELTPKRGAK